MADGQQYEAFDQKTGRYWDWNGTSWVERKAESTLAKVGRGAALGAFSGAGISERLETTPGKDPSIAVIEDTLKNLREQAQTILGRPLPPGATLRQKIEREKESLRATPLVGIPENLVRTGGNLYDQLLDKLLQSIPGKTGERMRAAREPESALRPRFDPETAAHEAASLVTQLLLLKGGKEAATTPLSESTALVGPGRVLRRGIREVSDVGPRDVARQAEKVAGENEAAMEAYRQRFREAREKDTAKIEAVRKETENKVREELQDRIRRSKLEGQKRSLGIMRDRVGERTTRMLDVTEQTEKASLDKRYAPYNKVIDPGTFDLAPLEQAIEKSQNEIQKGTPTNQPIFNSILSRIKEKEGVSGEATAIPGANRIRGDQLRGYISELGDAMFKGELPFDVYKALKNVREKAKGLVQAYVDDTMGKQAGQSYRDLQADWSKYEETWHDKRSGSPLVRALDTIRRKGRNVPVYREVSDQLLRKTPGEQAIGWLAKKRSFGAEPQLVAKLRDIDTKMRAIKVPGEPKPVPQIPGERPAPMERLFKSTEKPKLPKTTEVKPAEVEEFDPRAFIEEAVRKKMRTGGNVGSTLGMFWAVEKLVPYLWGQGDVMGAMKVITGVLGFQAAKYLLTSPGFLKWVSKTR